MSSNVFAHISGSHCVASRGVLLDPQQQTSLNVVIQCQMTSVRLRGEASGRGQVSECHVHKCTQMRASRRAIEIEMMLVKIIKFVAKPCNGCETLHAMSII
jgi:hypothetical protein